MSTTIKSNPSKLLAEHSGGLPELERVYTNGGFVEFYRALDAVHRTLAKRHHDGPPKFGPGVIETYSGRAYDFENPDPESIVLEDIAHALSNACRYAGHTKRFYSVAEHSVLVSRILEASGYDFWSTVGLFHDAHEAYVWDAPRPIKPLLGPDFERLAAKADEAICTALFDDGSGLHILPSEFHDPTIKLADDTALVAESLELMTHGAERWESHPDVGPLPPKVQAWVEETGGLGKPPAVAKRMFQRRAEELGVS